MINTVCCVSASCSNPGSPEHGYRIGSDFGHGGQVTFLCLPKYSLLGSSTMTCHDGKWSSVLPVCKGIIVYKFSSFFGQSLAWYRCVRVQNLFLLIVSFKH